MPFSGRRVLALESRRAAETAELIRKQQGDPFVAPSMREVPLEHNEEAVRFAKRLFAGDFDMIIFLTGVGTRFLNKVIETRYPGGLFAEALRKITTVARGPKPSAALREMDVPVTVQVPEPNTWREIVVATEDRAERSVAIQEFGKPSPELVEALEARGAKVTSVRVYQWDLPEDLGPLREAAWRLSAGKVDVSLFTSSVQLTHLFQIASTMGIEETVRDGLRKTVIGSIGPTTSETLAENGVPADLEPSHPKLGLLVRETADRCDELIAKKRTR
jgi:uroporphyrinogen-III synthase